MSVVSWMVETADGFLVDAAESQFGAVASNTGTIVLLMVTLSLIGVCINMAFQFRSMDGASFFWYLIKLTLIGLFAFNWANFNAVANAVIGGLDYVAGALISSVGGGGAGATYFAAEFDDLDASQWPHALPPPVRARARFVRGRYGSRGGKPIFDFRIRPSRFAKPIGAAPSA